MTHAVSTYDLEDILDLLLLACDKGANGRVSVHEAMTVIGNRSFGPLLLVPGLIGLSPIGAIPGVPGVMAVIVMVVAGQILIGMDHAWLPDALGRRSIETTKLRTVLKAIHPYARYVDRFIGPRLTLLTGGFFFYVLAALCLMVAIVTPIIELVPLAGIVPNAAIVAYALAITARDGLWALIALVFTGGSIYLLALAF